MARREEEGRLQPGRGDLVRESAELRATLHRIDGASYGRYKQLLGRYRLGAFELAVDRIPPDPFAGSARMRLVCSVDECGLPADLTDDPHRRLGVEDYLACVAADALQRQLGGSARGGAGSGKVQIVAGGPAVVERSACRITNRSVELRLFVDLPAAGRRIRARAAERLLLNDLSRLATATLLFSARRAEQARVAANNVEDHLALQRELERRGLVAFVADGSLLPRVAGDDQRPRRDGREVAFKAPPDLRVRLDTPHGGEIEGLGIPAGVTLIVGGGFHGKSTLLDAIARGIHPHRPGDGRERVATRSVAVVIRAEDGRSVRAVDISAFLGELPSGARPASFTTEKASGSTSQASSIIEALEVGAGLLLLDEDRCATNFMVRDGRMQRLVPRPAEPIVPLLERVRELYRSFGVSTLLVTGGSGDYLEVADTVIQMQAYEPRDVTRRAREIAEQTRTMRLDELPSPMERPAPRAPLPEPRVDPQKMRTGSRGPRAVRLGDETVELRALEQIVETGQVRALGLLMRRAASKMGPGKSLEQLVTAIDHWLDERGIDALDSPVAYDLARPRRFELAAALNRWRGLRFTPQSRRRER
jgi:predicted ABC-class ATPase